MLALLRPVVDEIVVAIDDRCDEELEAVLAPVADTLLRYPYAAPVDRPLPWLHAQCSGDWVLTIDDDEVPGAQLLDALRDVVSSGDCTHYLVPRRWLFPAADRYLDMSPWRLDYQLRIVQNDRRLLDFPTTLHQPIRVLVGPGRRIEQPIYHLDCIQNARDVRERKARSYEQQLTGCRTAGRSLNHAYYVPEQRENLATARVPAPDLALIRSVLAAGEAPKVRPTDGGVRARAVSRDEIDRLWAGRGLSDEDYRARLTPLGDASHMRCGELRPLDVRIENLGGASWPAAGCSGPEIRLSYHWVRPETGERIEGTRTPPSAEIAPGSTTISHADVVAPQRPGRWRLELDLVHEHRRWFGCTTCRDVDVLEGRRLAILHTGPTDGVRAELQRLAHADPELEPVLLTTAPEQLRGWYAGLVALSPERYLLAGLPARRWGAALLVAARAGRVLSLAWATRRGRRGAGAPPEIAEFLDVLAAAERLLLTSGRRALPPGDRVVALTTRLASMALGVKRATLRA